MLKETQLKGSDYSYILGREFVIFSNGVTMSIEEFKNFHNKGILVKKIMSLARVPKRLSDYQTALETGIMTPKYMPIRTMQLNPVRPKNKKLKKNKEITVTDYETAAEIEPDRPAEIEYRPEKRRLALLKNKGQVILLSMLFVAVGSACMSIYHATAFLTQGGKPFLISAMTALLLVIFASTGFTAARYFSEQRGFAKMFSIPFIFITSVLICYIAFSTTSVSYEQFRDEEASKVSTVNKEIGSLELYKEVQKNIVETESYIRRLEKVKTEEITVYAFARHQKMLAAEREKLQKLREKSYDLKEKSGGGSIADKKQSITSVYDFLMELFGINSRVLRFIIYVIPAVFYDVVAPFGFTVVFFLVDNKIKEDCDEA
jgi:BMFP domain-containing protein YqiC